MRLRVLAGLAVLTGALVACGPSAPVPPPTLSPAPSSPPKVDDTGVVPAAIRIPSAGVDGHQFMPLGLLSDNTLQVPDVHTPTVAGYYTGAPIVGDPGSAVIVAHVDGYGKHGLFYNLSDVKVHDTIFVDRSDGKTATFSVYKTAKYCKDKSGCPKGEKVFPSKEFYSSQARAELHLDTCGGRYDAADRNYLEAIVVYAKLTSLKLTSLK